MRSAPSGRNSEQGLAPRSKYSRLYAAEYFGHRKSMFLKRKVLNPHPLAPASDSPLKLMSKACEARPVGETASRVWRRGQNIRGVMPQNILGTARVYKRTTEKIRFPISTVAVQAGNGFSFPFFGSVIFLLSEKVRFFIKSSFRRFRPGKVFLIFFIIL